MSFCFLYNVVLENYSVQNSPWGGGGLLSAQGLSHSIRMTCKWSCFKFMSLFYSNWPSKMAASAVTKNRENIKQTKICVILMLSYLLFHWVPNVKAQSRFDIAFRGILVFNKTVKSKTETYPYLWQLESFRVKESFSYFRVTVDGISPKQYGLNRARWCVKVSQLQLLVTWSKIVSERKILLLSAISVGWNFRSKLLFCPKISFLDCIKQIPIKFGTQTLTDSGKF